MLCNTIFIQYTIETTQCQLFCWQKTLKKYYRNIKYYRNSPVLSKDMKTKEKQKGLMNQKCSDQKQNKKNCKTQYYRNTYDRNTINKSKKKGRSDGPEVSGSKTKNIPVKTRKTKIIKRARFVGCLPTKAIYQGNLTEKLRNSGDEVWPWRGVRALKLTRLRIKT